MWKTVLGTNVASDIFTGNGPAVVGDAQRLQKDRQPGNPKCPAETSTHPAEINHIHTQPRHQMCCVDSHKSQLPRSNIRFHKPVNSNERH